jgi:hypothetical protein
VTSFCQVDQSRVAFINSGFEVKEGALTFTCPELKNHEAVFGVLKIAIREIARPLENSKRKTPAK